MNRSHSLLSAWLVFSCYASTWAQNRIELRHSPTERARKATEWMKKELSLSDSQVVVLEKINLKYAKMNQSVIDGSGSRYTKHQQVKSNIRAKEQELMTILTPSQYRYYISLKAQKQQDLRQ